MENLSSSFPRYPDLPSRITQDMESKDIIRLQRDLTTNALSLMGDHLHRSFLYDVNSAPGVVCAPRWIIARANFSPPLFDARHHTLANAIIRLPAKPRLPLPSSPRSRNWTLDPNSSARFSFPPGFLSPLHQLPGPFHLRFFPPRFPDHSTFSRFRFTVFGVFSTTLHTDSWGGV